MLRMRAPRTTSPRLGGALGGSELLATQHQSTQAGRPQGRALGQGRVAYAYPMPRARRTCSSSSGPSRRRRPCWNSCDSNSLPPLPPVAPSPGISDRPPGCGVDSCARARPGCQRAPPGRPAAWLCRRARVAAPSHWAAARLPAALPVKRGGRAPTALAAMPLRRLPAASARAQVPRAGARAAATPESPLLPRAAHHTRGWRSDERPTRCHLPPPSPTHAAQRAPAAAAARPASRRHCCGHRHWTCGGGLTHKPLKIPFHKSPLRGARAHMRAAELPLALLGLRLRALPARAAQQQRRRGRGQQRGRADGHADREADHVDAARRRGRLRRIHLRRDGVVATVVGHADVLAVLRVGVQAAHCRARAHRIGLWLGLGIG